MDKFCIITNESDEIFNSNNFSLRSGDSVIVPLDLGYQITGDFDFIVMEDSGAAAFLSDLGYLPFQPFYRFVDESPPEADGSPTSVEDVIKTPPTGTDGSPTSVEDVIETPPAGTDSVKEMLANHKIEVRYDEKGVVIPSSVVTTSRYHFDSFMSKEAMLAKRDKKKYKLTLVELAEKVLKDREDEKPSKAKEGREAELAFRVQCEMLENPSPYLFGSASKYFSGRNYKED